MAQDEQLPEFPSSLNCHETLRSKYYLYTSLTEWKDAYNASEGTLRETR